MRVVSQPGGVRAVAVLPAVAGEAGPALAEVDHLAVQAACGGTDPGVVRVGELLPGVEVGGPHPLLPPPSARPEAVGVAPGVGGARRSPLERRSGQTQTRLEG